MHAAFDGDTIVGGAGAYTFDMSVPGGSLPCAGVTVVGVYPTHRRRGVLRSMMHAQLDDVHERGEPIAALWASEETIYGRFGYGLAAWAGEVKLPREWSAFAQPLERRGQMRLRDAGRGDGAFPAGLGGAAPPASGRPSRARRRGGKCARSALRRSRRRTRSASSYSSSTAPSPATRSIARTSISRARSRPAATEVIEAVATTPQATAEVWRYLLDIDWAATITAQLLPPDHPLFLLLANPRRLFYTAADSLWVRLVDVGAALSGRTYVGEGRIVVEVRDAVCPWNEGRWLVENGRAARTEEAADLALDVNVLGSAYLGAVSFAELRNALRVEELQPGAIERADALFTWRPLPWCPEIF